MSRCPKCKTALDAGAGFCTRCGAKIAQERAQSRSAGRGDRRTAVIPAVLVLVGIAIVVAAALWWQNDQPDQQGAQAPTVPATSRVVPTAAPSIPYPDVPRISVQDAAGRLDELSAIFLDTRSAGVYDQSRIAGAILIEPAELEARYQELSPQAEIITYCT